MQIRASAILSPDSPNPFTMFLLPWNRRKKRRDWSSTASFQSPPSNLKGFGPHIGPLVFPAEAFVVPHTPASRARNMWDGAHKFRRKRRVRRGWLSRALFSDNVSRIETAFKQPINGVTRPFSPLGLGGQFRQISGNCCYVQKRCLVSPAESTSTDSRESRTGPVPPDLSR